MKRVLLHFAVLACAAGLAAQELSWPDLARMAASQNPDLAASLRDEEAARARYRGSFNGFLPRVGLSQSYSDSSGASASSRWRAGADASLDVFSLENIYGSKAASAALEQARARRRLVSANLRFDLFSAYAGVLFARAQVDVSRKIHDIRRENAQMVALKYQSGRESKGNSMRAEAELAQAEADLAQAQRGLRAAAAELNRRLGIEGVEAPAVTGTFSVPPLPEAPDAALSAAHPQVILGRLGVAQAKAELGRSRGAFWPSLSANYSRSFQDEKYFPANPGWSASGVVSWPLFGRGPTASYYDAAAARQDFRRREETLRAALYEVRSGLEAAWAGLAEKIDQVGVQRRFLLASRQRNQEAGVRYATGLMSFENWELVVTDLVNFEKGVLRAERDAALAGAAWEKALGTPLEER